MSNELSTVVREGPTHPSWGRANPLRGAGYHDHATAFLDSYPIGTVLSQSEFCDWAERQGLIRIPRGASKQSDTWKAHLQRRHELRYNINKAAAHPRMLEQNTSPFIIESNGPDILEVRSVQVAVTKSSIGKQLASLVKTKQQQLAYLMQSADWPNLLPHERAMAETLYDDISAFGEDIEIGSARLANKFAKLEHRLRSSGVNLLQLNDNSDNDGE